MQKIIRYKYPILLTMLSLTILLTFQRCGGGKGGSSPSSSNSSPIVSASTTFAPDSYFIEYKNYGGTTDSVIFGFVLDPNFQFTGYLVRFTGGNYSVGHYQISKGTYKFSSANKFDVTYTRDTCNDLTPESFEISGTSGDFVFLKQDSVAIKFLSEQMWTSSSGFPANNGALIEDVNCEKF